MSFDPSKWADALKSAISTAGTYKLALAIGCGLYWFAATRQFIPEANPWEFRIAAIGFLLFGLLWVANLVAGLLQFLQPAAHVAHWVKLRKEQSHLRSYIPSMTEKEREIVGYLLARNQKLFDASQDGGHAMPLLSQRIVIVALQPGQVFTGEHTPMVIPNHMWKVLVEHKDQFPTEIDENAPYPWRRDWMD